VKIGLILPMTGGQALDPASRSTTPSSCTCSRRGRQPSPAQEDRGHPSRTTPPFPDNTKRLAQELIVNDKVSFHRRLRRDARGAGGGAACDASEDPGNRDGGRAPRSLPSVSPYIVAHQPSRWRSPATIIGDWARQETASRRSRRSPRTTRPAMTR